MEQVKARPQMRYVIVILVAVGVVAAVAAVRRGPDDEASARALEGAWVAVDPSNNALHRREEPVQKEKILFRHDGTLRYSLELASAPGKTEDVEWAWKVRKARLYVRFLGEEAGGDWLPGISFAVTPNTLTVRIKNRPVKEFVRP